MIKKVYIVFKTHLDIGFTDFGGNVVKKYLEEFIPDAIKRGYELKDTDTPYIWTTGSWLINEALKYDKDGLVQKAIEDSIIKWHGLPFTPFSEFMSKELFDYGLSLSKKLDKRFGKKTISAKCSDVPGHTKAIIKPLVKNGIEFLHIGVNAAYPLPDVPPLFRWRDGDDEIITMYQSSYGDTYECGDFALTFGFTGDNDGPQKVSTIQWYYKTFAEKYPGAQIVAATLDDVALKLREIKDTLPVVTGEVGDRWIQNVGTDPKKVSLYRELLRYIEKNGIDGDITDNLLVVPEHTWGADPKTMYPSYDAYFLKDFSDTSTDPDRIKLEKSWQEQREYVDKAQKVLGTSFDYDVKKPDLSACAEIEIPECDFEISWQLFDNEDYDNFCRKGLLPEAYGEEWVIKDNCKYNLPSYKGGTYVARPVKAYRDGDAAIINFEFDEKIKKEQGLASIYAKIEGGFLEIDWFEQKANRLPQAYWLKFKNLREENWQIRKIGQWIDAKGIIGNPMLSATDFGVRNDDVVIECLDSSLVAPYGKKLLDFELNPQKQDMYFNLYNNVWGCNQPMWYAEDSKFRFLINKMDN